jgi:hypothetical protein
MILPKGEVRHQNLLTSYTDFSALLSTLKSEGFSGIVEVDVPESKGVLFIDSGEVVNGEVNPGDDSKRMVGHEAIRTLFTLAKQKDGVLNIYRLSPERVAMAAGNLRHEVLFKGLSTDFTRLDGLLMKLREEKHNGFIEVFSKQNQAMGVFFLEGGEPVELFTSSDTGESGFTRKSILPFIENVIKEGAILNVYRSQKDGDRSETPAMDAKELPKEPLDEITSVLQEILYKTEKLVDFGSGKKGTFHRAFTQSLLKKAEEYPFLDPFSKEFKYEDGFIHFSGEAEGRIFVKGLGDCLRAALSHALKELPKNKMLGLKLKTEIESSLERHQETLKRMGVDISVSSFI